MTIQKRRTVQKSAIEDALLRSRGHISAEELHLLVRKHVPRISIGTIYRNLKSLTDQGKVSKIVAPDGRLVFEINSGKHHHLQCLNCNKVVDCSIDSSDLTQIMRKAADSGEFVIKDVSITFEGFCSACEAVLSKKA